MLCEFYPGNVNRYVNRRKNLHGEYNHMANEKHEVRLAATLLNRKLEDEYEAHQLNPGRSDATKDKASHEKILDMIKKIPEVDSVKQRMAAMEAIVDELAESKIEDDLDEGLGIDEKRVEAVVEPVVEKAIELCLIPSTFRTRAKLIVHNKMRKTDRSMRLLSKVACSVAGSMVTMKDDCVISDVLDDTPADIGTDINIDVIQYEGDSAQEGGNVPTTKMKKSWRFGSTEANDDFLKEADDIGIDAAEDTVVYEGDNAQEGGTVPTTQMRLRSRNSRKRIGREDLEPVEPGFGEDEPADIGIDIETDAVVYTGDNAQEGGTVPTTLPKPQAEAMKFLLASSVNHRRAIAMVSRRYTGSLLTSMMFELRHVLPEKFRKEHGF